MRMSRWLALLGHMVAVLLALIGWAGLGFRHGQAILPEAHHGTYAYDGHHASSYWTNSTTKRGPPATHGRDTTYDAVDRWSRGGSARPERSASGSTTSYTALAARAEATTATAATGGPVGAADGALSSLPRSVGAANGVDNVSTVLMRTPLQLQKKFKHAGDFGVTGGYSKVNASKFSAAMHQHMNAAGTQRIVGTYRSAPARHYLDPNTGLNVVSDLDGNFMTGFRLGSGQLNDVLTTGRLW